MNRVRRIGGLLAAAVLLGWSGSTTATVLEYVPVDHAIYRDLEWLRTAGVLEDLDPGARPWSRNEIAESVRAAESPLGDVSTPMLRRVQREFARELDRLGEDTPYRESPPILAVGDETSAFRVDSGLSFSASGDGWDDLQFDPGSRGFVRFEWSGRPNLFATSEILAQRVDPDRVTGDTLIKDTNLLVDTEEAYLSIDTQHVDALFGLTEVRWGPGRTGTLLLSDAATPRAMLRVSSRIADRLELHAITLSLSQTAGQYVSAHRVSWRVRRGLTVGVSEAARYDATSPQWLYVVGLIPYTVVHKIQVRDADGPEDIDSRNNVMMGMDVEWRIRPGWRAYGEFLLDDLATESDGMPNRMAWQIGLDHVRSVAGVPAALLIEATKVLRYTYATFYDRNHIVDGDPLGYESGPDTERYHAEVRVDPRPEWSTTITTDLVRRGRGFLGEFWSPSSPEDPWGTLRLDGPVERTRSLEALVEWLPRDDVRVGAGGGYRWTRHAGGIRGVNGNHPLARISGHWRF